jgi:tyrosine-specific transport protein
MNKKFWATAFTLTGTIIGAGILGLPYVFAKAGFLIGLFWLVLLGIIMIIVNLYLGEITLKTKPIHQLAGYAKKYLGHKAGKIMLFATLFGIYSALIAYLIGEGQSLAQLFLGNLKYSVLFGIKFWLGMTLLLREGLRGLKKIETWGVLIIIGIILGIFIWFLPSANLSNLKQINPSDFFLPFGVVLFALLGFASIPELRREIKGQEKNLKKAIILGSLIPIILYILFSGIFVSVLGTDIEQVATISFGPIIIILGIFTMLTSYFVLSFALKDIFMFDLRFSKRKTLFLVSILPLIFYIFLSVFNIAGFIEVLGLSGVISGGITGILILFANQKAKTGKKADRKSEYSIPINWIIILLISLIFVLGILTEFLF